MNDMPLTDPDEKEALAPPASPAPARVPVPPATAAAKADEAALFEQFQTGSPVLLKAAE